MALQAPHPDHHNAIPSRPNTGRARALWAAAEWTFEFIGVPSPTGALLDANRSALDFAGVSLGDVVGQPFWDTPWWKGLPQREWLRHAVARAAAGELVRGEVEHAGAEGRSIFVDFSLKPLHDASGKLRSILAEGRDISDRREAERKLQASEEKFAFLAEASAVLASSLDYEATLANVADLLVPRLATWCCVYLLQPEGTVRCVRAAHHRPEMQAVLERLVNHIVMPHAPSLAREVIEDRRPILIPQMTDGLLERMSMDDVHLDALRAVDPRSAISVPLVARGQSLGAITIMRDSAWNPYDEGDFAVVSELASRAALAVDNARLYEESRRATRGRDEMLAVVSHDLRNPLSLVSMCTAALLETPDHDLTTRLDLLGTVRDSVDWAHRLIEDLLDITSMEMGRLSLDKQPIDPVLLAAQAVDLFEPLADAQQIRMHLDVPERLRRVHADAERMIQALGNLVGNAIKFTPAGGEIRLGAGEDGADVCFTVSDTGPGVPPEDAPFVFDRYWQHHRNATSRGTRLGLAIVKGIAEAHGGRAWLELPASGGSRFGISLPVT